MAGFSDYLLGEKPHPGTIAATLLIALAMAIVVAMRTEEWDWQTVILALLAADIGAGLVSNATEATRARWRGRSGARIGFLVVHLTLYPAALFLLARGDLALFGFLVTVLLAKVLVFVAGKHERPA